MRKIKLKNKRRKKIRNFLFLITVVFTFFSIKNTWSISSLDISKNIEAINNCLNSPFKMDNLEERIEEELSAYKKNNISLAFKNINNNYVYYYNEDKNYYSASAIKLFDAIYLIENAKEEKINLDDTLIYQKDDMRAGSIKTEEHRLNDKIDLKTLLNYSISVSDNSAHYMIVEYLGANNMNKYFKEHYNVNLYLSNSKPFSYNYNAKIALKSLEGAYGIIKENDMYSKLLSDAMNNDYVNALNYDDVKLLHKYGYYDYTFHDIGIYTGDNPYLIVILSEYGRDDFVRIFKNIHESIRKVYQENLDAKNNYCHNI